MKVLFIGTSVSTLTVDRLAFIRDAVSSAEVHLLDTARSDEKGPAPSRVGFPRRLGRYVIDLLHGIAAAAPRRVDVVHYHGANHALLNLLPLFFRGRIIVTPQGSDINQGFRGPHRFFVRFLLRRAHVITAKSRVMRDRVEEILGPGEGPAPVTLFNWGIDPVFFEAEPRSDPEAVRILSIRATRPLYNLDLLFDAIRVLRERHPRLRFTYLEFGRAGSVDLDLSVCDRHCDQLSAPELARLVAEHDFVVSIPSFDGFSTSVMETLAVGSYPVLSDIAAYRGELGDERVAKKVQIHDVEAVIAGLEDCIARVESIRRDAGLRKRFAQQAYSRTGQRRVLQRIYAPTRAARNRQRRSN